MDFYVPFITIFCDILECGEPVMKPGSVSSVSNNQAKWSNTQSKNFIINAVPVKNEVSSFNDSCNKNTHINEITLYFLDCPSWRWSTLQ